MAGCAAVFASGPAAAPAGAAGQRLSGCGVHVVAGPLVDSPGGGPLAAMWSETARHGAAVRVAFARPDGSFPASRVVLRTRLPIVTLGAAASPSGSVVVVGAHLRRGGGAGRSGRLRGLVLRPDRRGQPDVGNRLFRERGPAGTLRLVASRTTADGLVILDYVG